MLGRVPRHTSRRRITPFYLVVTFRRRSRPREFSLLAADVAFVTSLLDKVAPHASPLKMFRNFNRLIEVEFQ